MTTDQLEEELLKNTKGLPKEALEEIIDFIQFVRKKKLKDANDNISTELTSLSASQTEHLEQEFKDYKKLYPRE
jgi:serine/threonine protein phosphatase PrpC